MRYDARRDLHRLHVCQCVRCLFESRTIIQKIQIGSFGTHSLDGNFVDSNPNIQRCSYTLSTCGLGLSALMAIANAAMSENRHFYASVLYKIVLRVATYLGDNLIGQEDNTSYDGMLIQEQSTISPTNLTEIWGDAMHGLAACSLDKALNSSISVRTCVRTKPKKFTFYYY